MSQAASPDSTEVPSVVNANKATICSAFVAIDRSYIETMNAFFSNSKLHSGCYSMVHDICSAQN
jgi:hypothetical protein